jgi:hypothetical protein
MRAVLFQVVFLFFIPFISINADTIFFQDDFESYTSDFNLTGAGYELLNGGAFIRSGDAVSGSNFASLEPTSNDLYFNKNLTLREEESYTYEVFTRSPGAKNHRAVVRVGNRTIQGTLNSNTNWEKVTINFKVETGESAVVLRVYSWPISNVDVDDIKLTGHFEVITQNQYYIDPVLGDNSNKGDTPDAPKKDFIGINSFQIGPGTKIMFKAGTTYNKQLALKDVFGDYDNPVIISSYWDGQSEDVPPATINGASYLSAIQIEDCNSIRVERLRLTANGGGFDNYMTSDTNRFGVLVRTTKAGNYGNIHLSELQVEDVYYYSLGETRPTSGENDSYGFGIRFYNQTFGAIMKNISIKNCYISRLSHTGIRFTGMGATSLIEDVEVFHNEVIHVGGPGMQLGSVVNAYVAFNQVDHSGSVQDNRNWKRGSGLWTWSAHHILIERNSFTNANGPADTAGAHIDFNCTDVIIQYNLSVNNAGGFVEILGNNHQCCYRYNISVNDGWRVKGVDGATQEGKTLWVSGYVGSNAIRNGPYNSYIYNNTIYVNESMVSKYSFEDTAEGILIANNIFHIVGNSVSVLGDQTNSSISMKKDEGDVFFERNLFLKTTNWPDSENIKDAGHLYGDAAFVNPGGTTIEDYIPTNEYLIKGRGVAIPFIPGDTYGLSKGFTVDTDILGNPVGNVIDLGAIAISITPNSLPQTKSNFRIVNQMNGFRVYYDMGKRVDFKLMNLSGQIIQSGTFEDALSIACESGIYILKLNEEVGKIVKAGF